MSLVFLITYIIWLVSEVLLNRLLRSKGTDKQNADKNTLAIIWITVVAAITLATLISIRFHIPIVEDPSIKYFGLGIMYLGIILRIAAVLSLGRMFTVDVTIREDHKLKQDGIYQFLRHPSYFASLLTFIGFGIALNNWLSLLLVTVAVLIVFKMRIDIEERALIDQFGEEYLNYRKRVKGLIPFVW